MSDINDHMSVDDMLASIVARDVAFGFEMARDLGHRVPTDYDVGFHRFLRLPKHNGIDTHFRIRVNEVGQDVRALVPHIDGRVSLVEVDRMWRDVMDRLSSAAITLANIWLERHPEARASAEQAPSVLARLRYLEQSERDQERWAAELRERVKRSAYTRVR